MLFQTIVFFQDKNVGALFYLLWIVSSLCETSLEDPHLLPHHPAQL